MLLDWIKTRIQLVAVGGLAAVAIVAALGMTWKAVQFRSERNAARDVAQTLTIWADRACEAVSVPFRPKGAKTVDLWGGACLDAIRTIRGERDAYAEASAQAALDAIAEQQTKMAADQARARKAEAARRAARRNMEAQDARITDDNTGPEWFAALNELGGLLRPTLNAPAEAPRGGPADQGNTPV